MAVAKWVAGASVALLATAAAAAPTFPANATGDWSGTVQAKDAPKHLFLHIHKTRGGYVATLDSPEREAGAIAVTPLGSADGILAFAADGGRFRGVWSDARGRWEGTWTEGDSMTPLTLSFNADNSMQPMMRLKSGARSPVVDGPEKAPAAVPPPDIVPPAAR